jgi:hypothetical protein
VLGGPRESVLALGVVWRIGGQWRENEVLLERRWS